MKNIATLNALRHQIAIAQTVYRNAIIDNLRECNTELEVLGEYYDKEDGWPKGLHLTILGEADNDPQDVVIDKVKFEDKKTSKVSLHVCYIYPTKADIWWSVSDLDTDCADLVLYSIQWPKEFYEHNIKG